MNLEPMKTDLRTLDDLTPGDRVRYISHHARLHAERNEVNARYHPDCEDGIVREVFASTIR